MTTHSNFLPENPMDWSQSGSLSKRPQRAVTRLSMCGHTDTHTHPDTLENSVSIHLNSCVIIIYMFLSWLLSKALISISSGKGLRFSQKLSRSMDLYCWESKLTDISVSEMYFLK